MDAGVAAAQDNSTGSTRIHDEPRLIPVPDSNLHCGTAIE